MTTQARDKRHLRITSAKLRALLHEAWKHGNNSENIDTEPAGVKERHGYVDHVMIDKGFKEGS